MAAKLGQRSVISIEPWHSDASNSISCCVPAQKPAVTFLMLCIFQDSDPCSLETVTPPFCSVCTHATNVLWICTWLLWRNISMSSFCVLVWGYNDKVYSCRRCGAPITNQVIILRSLKVVDGPRAWYQRYKDALKSLLSWRCLIFSVTEACWNRCSTFLLGASRAYVTHHTHCIAASWCVSIVFTSQFLHYSERRSKPFITLQAFHVNQLVRWYHYDTS